MSTRSRKVRVGLVVGALGVSAVAGALTLQSQGPVAADSGATGEGAVATAKVERRDLVETLGVGGTLGYGEAPDVRAHRAGTLTSTSEPGTVLERGTAAYSVDGRLIPVLYGDVPMWRRLDVGDEGVDVRQLEENLVALGFATDEQLKGDGKYDSRTATAVKRWQEALGVDETGTVEFGDFEFVAGPVRVAENLLAVGDQVGPGAGVLGVTGTTREVTVEIEARQQALVGEGDAVVVELADGSSVDATISEVGRVAVTEGSDIPGASGTPMISFTVTLADGAAAGAFDSTPVTVRLTKRTAEGVLAVPVRALLALSEGGYALEVVQAGGRTLVGVDLGTFADGWVEVTGDVREGDEVVIAP